MNKSIMIESMIEMNEKNYSQKIEASHRIPL